MDYEVGVGYLLIASCFCFGLLHSGLLNLEICSFRISLVFSFTVWLTCNFGLLLLFFGFVSTWAPCGVGFDFWFVVWRCGFGCGFGDLWFCLF